MPGIRIPRARKIQREESRRAQTRPDRFSKLHRRIDKLLPWRKIVSADDHDHIERVIKWFNNRDLKRFRMFPIPAGYIIERVK